MKMIPLIAAVALLLAACGTASNVELQKDGTGTDEMLKSPCACATVPYEPQTFRWEAS